ncbi:hypothetical protein ACFVWR_09455 [Leifsonia sp. NPDC058292]|uniref:hypothetical protein n=1 Tax=Leifsonia sp. NPDC058292 TaxID=3346428 RepID=UPI0036DE81C1
MASREHIENLAQALLIEHGDELAKLRDAMFRLIDASSAEANPRPTEPIAVASPDRDDVLCIVSAVCVAASEGQPITLIATRVSAVDREEEDVSPTDAEALAFSRALLGESWFAQSLRDRHEVADPARASRGVRLYLSSDFQPGIPEVLGDSLVATISTID